MSTKRAGDLEPGDRIVHDGQILEVVPPPDPPVKIHATVLDERGTQVGTAMFTRRADDEVELAP